MYRSMACCPAPDHLTGDDHDCFKSLYNANASSLYPFIQQYESTISDTVGGYDQHLLVITQNLSRLPDECLVFLRRYGVLDEGDSQVLLNDSKIPSTNLKLLELVNILTKKPHHAYWYFAHSMKSKAFPIYQHLHGDVICCGKWAASNISKRETKFSRSIPSCGHTLIELSILQLTRTYFSLFIVDCDLCPSKSKDHCSFISTLFRLFVYITQRVLLVISEPISKVCFFFTTVCKQIQGDIENQARLKGKQH